MKYKHLSYSDRQEMEKLYLQGWHMNDIKRVHSNGGWSLMDYWIET